MSEVVRRDTTSSNVTRESVMKMSSNQIVDRVMQGKTLITRMQNLDMVKQFKDYVDFLSQYMQMEELTSMKNRLDIDVQNLCDE